MSLEYPSFMFKKHYLFISLSIFLVISMKIYSQEKSFEISTIVIDAGHGGKDPGATNHHTYEKDITLTIALKVGKTIKRKYPNIQVIYTREKDVFIPLFKRTEIANKYNADLFISIHANSIKKKYVAGTETYVLGLHRSEDNLRVAMKENAAMFYEKNYKVRYKGFDPSIPESYIVFNLMQNQHLDNSLLFAQLVEEEFFTYSNRNSRGVKQAGFLVLREVSMPSVLIETGFLTNREEKNYLLSNRGQNSLATAIFRAFRKYKTIVEKDINIIEKNEINVYYAVQILSLSRKMDFSPEITKNLPNFKEHLINNTYKYTIGKTKDKMKIDKLQKKYSLTYKNCFVVAFYNNKRISLSKAKRIIAKSNE